jgi:hypothetical protein
MNFDFASAAKEVVSTIPLWWPVGGIIVLAGLEVRSVMKARRRGDATPQLRKDGQGPAGGPSS